MNSRRASSSWARRAHAVEDPRQLAELVQAVIDDGLVEAAGRDPLGRPLEPLDPARERPCSAVADAERDQEPDEARDQQAPLDHVDRLVLRREFGDEQNRRPGAIVRKRDLREGLRLRMTSRARPAGPLGTQRDRVVLEPSLLRTEGVVDETQEVSVK